VRPRTVDQRLPGNKHESRADNLHVRWVFTALALAVGLTGFWAFRHRYDRTPIAKSRTMKFATSKYSAREVRTIKAMRPRIPAAPR
jgi:hypothetical protein